MLHISPQEQRRRLQARIDEPDKRWKYSMGDLEVRRKWDGYERAYDRLLSATSTRHAPWQVVPADDKLVRNVIVARLLVDALEGMKLKAPPGDPGLRGVIVQ
jgi:polyphosphate kinase 2 (PPK2 family)